MGTLSANRFSIVWRLFLLLGLSTKLHHLLYREYIARLNIVHSKAHKKNAWRSPWENIAWPSDNFFGCTKFTRSSLIAHFAVDILLLHHYKSDLAHLSYFDSLVYCQVDRDASLSVHILLLHHYKSDLAHISYFDSLIIGLSKSELSRLTEIGGASCRERV